jgi:hypothetical protein
VLRSRASTEIFFAGRWKVSVDASAETASILLALPASSPSFVERLLFPGALATG